MWAHQIWLVVATTLMFLVIWGICWDVTVPIEKLDAVVWFVGMCGFVVAAILTYIHQDIFDVSRRRNLIITACLFAAVVLIDPFAFLWAEPGDKVGDEFVLEEEDDNKIRVGGMVLNLPPGRDPSHAPPNIVQAIDEGKKMLAQTPLPERRECGKHGKKRCRDLTLAVASVDGEVILVKAEENSGGNGDITWTCSNPEFLVKANSRFNGVNTDLTITVPSGWTVVANEYNIGRKGGKRESAIYVPYNQGLDTPAVREAGLRYLAELAGTVHDDFAQRAVPSKHVKGVPIADLVEAEMLVAIVLVENTDAVKFDYCGDDDACKLQLVNNALTLIGANQEDAFKYRFSSVGAGGLAQIWKPTYGGLRAQYPEAGLPAKFRAVTQHDVALRAALAHFDAELQPLSQDRINFYRANPDAKHLYFAAAYNGSATRVNRAINDHGMDWRSHLCTKKSCETRTYVEKFDFVWNLIFGRGLDSSVVEQMKYDSAN